MKGREILHSSNSDEWETPQAEFDYWNAKYDFTLDAAASYKNRKCELFFSKEIDALGHRWCGRVWCNPPYSQWQKFVKKGAEEIANCNAELVCFLLPARTDTCAFHSYIWDASNSIPWPGVKVHFLRGRLRFSGSKNSAPFPSMVVVMLQAGLVTELYGSR